MNELMNQTNANAINVAPETPFYCTFTPANDNDRALLYKAMTSCDMPLSKMLNKEINVRDFVIESREAQRETGEFYNGYSIGIIDTDGVTYHTGSSGVYASLRQMALIYGMPTWENGVRVTVEQVATKSGHVYKLIPVFTK